MGAYPACTRPGFNPSSTHTKLYESMYESSQVIGQTAESELPGTPSALQECHVDSSPCSTLLQSRIYTVLVPYLEILTYYQTPADFQVSGSLTRRSDFLSKEVLVTTGPSRSLLPDSCQETRLTAVLCCDTSIVLKKGRRDHPLTHLL